jgi:hypothetical protein
MTVVLRYEIWIMGDPRRYPAIVHEFRGDSREEARAAYEAHLDADNALRSCHDTDRTLDGRRCLVRWWFYDDEAAVAADQDSDEDGDEDSTSVGAGEEDPGWGAEGTYATDASAGAIPEYPPRMPSQSRSQQAQTRGFRPRVIEGGRSSESGQDSARPPGHEDHDPDVCDVRTG